MTFLCDKAGTGQLSTSTSSLKSVFYYVDLLPKIKIEYFQLVCISTFINGKVFFKVFSALRPFIIKWFVKLIKFTRLAEIYKWYRSYSSWPENKFMSFSNHPKCLNPACSFNWSLTVLIRKFISSYGANSKFSHFLH